MRNKAAHTLQAAQWGDGTMGSTFLKAVYREYTDDTFTERKPLKHESDGLAGPMLVAEVGDLITVVFKVQLDRAWASHLKA